MIERRKFLTELISLVAAPAIVRAGSLMPVKRMEDFIPMGMRVDIDIIDVNNWRYCARIATIDISSVSAETVEASRNLFAMSRMIMMK